MRKSLSSLFTKEWPRANHSHLFLQTSVKSESLSLLFKKERVSDSLVISTFALKKERFAKKNV